MSISPLPFSGHLTFQGSGSHILGSKSSPIPIPTALTTEKDELIYE